MDLSVIPWGSGVSAKCEFEGYEPDAGYSMELYLNRVQEDGAVAEIALKGIFAPGSGAGMEITEEKQVEPGVYKATLVLDRTDGGMPAVDNFRNSILYDVIRNAEGYLVRPHREEEQEQEGQGAKVPGGHNDTINASEKALCNHSAYDIVYCIVKAASPDEDAVLAGECGKCREVLSYSSVPNSAYAAFLENAACTILNAQAGEAVIVTRRWLSFNRTVFDAIARRPEIAVTVRYQYEGRQYEVIIPAGANVNGLTDENGFCGFRYLDQVFGGREIAE